jgi:single-strand DNA-binding protein
MRYSKWVDKHDQNRTSAEVIANSFSFIGSGNRQFNDRDMSSSMVADPGPEERNAKTQRRRERTVAALDETVLKTADADLPF